MVRVNMLPPEFRRAEGMSLHAILLLLSGLGLAVVWIFALMLFYVNVRGDYRAIEGYEIVQQQLSEREEVLKRLICDVERKHASGKAILGIRKRRVLWARKLDRLARLTPKGRVWWENIRMEQLDPKPGQENGGKMTVECYLKGNEISTLVSYRESITKDRIFWQGFEAMSPPWFRKMPGRDILKFSMTFFLEQPETEIPAVITVGRE